MLQELENQMAALRAAAGLSKAEREKLQAALRAKEESVAALERMRAAGSEASARPIPSHPNRTRSRAHVDTHSHTTLHPCPCAPHPTQLVTAVILRTPSPVRPFHQRGYWMGNFPDLTQASGGFVTRGTDG